MTDMELTKATAYAMGFTILYHHTVGSTPYLDCHDRQGGRVYTMWSPLKSDEQCMSLVKKFDLNLQPDHEGWCVSDYTGDKVETRNKDLNRAIVECVAKMQIATLAQ